MSAADAPDVFPAPPTPLVADDRHWVSWTNRVWRVHEQKTGRPGWDELRHFGPVDGQRFDPQDPPTGDHKPQGVQYVAGTMLVAVTETFQRTRMIPVHNKALWLYGWTPARPMRLLDIRSDFGATNGASASFNAADKATTREWARAAHRQWTDLDGLLYTAKVSGGDAIALFTNAAGIPVWPDYPSYARALTDPAAHPDLSAAAAQVHWGLDYGA
ncbi:RES family NAD+ phosphorylase [Curtobacterium sp. WHRI 8282]|uniref:RES family NAD+ phosphorylase n=1 Tax=Curtobacterium sp. WHRI 8282 TaxID=3162559 RepID=UPI0032ECB4B1